MDFQRLLLEVGKNLGKDEVKALAFLCTDLLGRSLTSVELANELFSGLMAQDFLSAEKPHLLNELLVTIGRARLARDFNLTGQVSTTGGLISPYRKLLYNLSEEITDEDLKHVKFLLNTTMPRRKLEENVTTLEILLEMEHMDLLSDTNLNELEKIIESVCPMLREKINQFKALQAGRQVPPIVNVNRVMSPQHEHYTAIHKALGKQRKRWENNDSLFVCHHQGCRPSDQEMPASSEIRESLAESFRNSCNTSLDECEAPSQGLSDLSIERSSSLKGESDALKMFPQENKTLSGELTFETTNTNSEILESYSMTAGKRGFCLIINNHKFATTCSLKDREGSMADEYCLHNVFQWLGFQTEIHRDCSSEGIRSLLQRLGSKDHSQMDCVVCCILSHGQEGSVYGVDGHTVELTELKEPLNGLKCSSLADKPKLFFIQACQGSSEQKAVYIESDCFTPNQVHSDALAVKESIPSDADYLFAMSTLPFFVSYRERKNGSWFIQSLCQNLVQMVPRGDDLVSILTKVNADVSQKTDSSGTKKQMPQPAFTLRKKVVFPIPKAPPPSLSSV